MEGTLFNSLVVVGLAALAGLALGKLVNRFKVPAVAGYVIAGVFLGSSALGLFSPAMLDHVDIVSELALSFIAFVIGSEMEWKSLKKLGRGVFTITIFECLGAFVFVGVAVYLYTFQLHMALILGAVASATAPAATMMVLRETRAKGVLTSTLLTVVAIDDAIALILYGFASSISKVLLHPGTEVSFKEMVMYPLIEIIGAIGLGVLVGMLVVPAAKRLKQPGEILVLIVGAILINSGLAKIFHFSPLLTNIALGTALVNLMTRVSQRIFDQINLITPPIYCMFFVLAGSRLQVGLITQIGWLGLIYLVMRFAGKILGAGYGGKISQVPETVRKYLGLGLLSQIGVAVGLAIIVRHDFPASLYGEAGRQLGLWVINTLLFTTLITEVVGPVCTRYAVTKAGEANQT
ncbi:MAG: cation:proton antiporter [bacterium]